MMLSEFLMNSTLLGQKTTRMKTEGEPDPQTPSM